MSIFDHVGLKVTDFDRALALYEAALGALGIKLLASFTIGKERHAGFGETRVSIDSSPKCTSCSEGYSSIGGKAAKCLPCLPGPPLLACLLPIKTPTAGSALNWLCLCK